MSMFPSFQVLELNIISAQELAPVFRKMKTYVNSPRASTTPAARTQLGMTSTIRVLISNLIPPNRRPGYRSNDASPFAGHLLVLRGY
ncbi:unnamed protein product [Brassica oleracea]